jgi:hypothetical protein
MVIEIFILFVPRYTSCFFRGLVVVVVAELELELFWKRNGFCAQKYLFEVEVLTSATEL